MLHSGSAASGGGPAGSSGAAPPDLLRPAAVQYWIAVNDIGTTLEGSRAELMRGALQLRDGATMACGPVNDGEC